MHDRDYPVRNHVAGDDFAAGPGAAVSRSRVPELRSRRRPIPEIKKTKKKTKKPMKIGKILVK